MNTQDSHSNSNSNFFLMFDFEKLLVYGKARAFNKTIFILLKEVKSKNIFDQFQRAAFSISLNIAEGSGRFSKADKRNFYVIARGSVFECVAVLDHLKDTNQISETQFNEAYLLLEEISKMLFAMIKDLG